jgi:hypothetical protein
MLMPSILADGQLIGVLLILAGAVGYLTLYYRRVMKGEEGGCSCGIPLRRKKAADTPPGAVNEASTTGGSRQQFLPVENLVDLAARHRRERGGEAETRDVQTPPE